MKNRKYSIFTSLIYFTLINIASAQFVDFSVELDMRRLSDNDKKLFETINQDIEDYYQNTQFSSDVNDLKISINCKIVFESVSSKGSQTTAKVQAIFSNKLDQYYYAKAIHFPYEKGKKLYFTNSFDPLISLLNYYAFIFIASELDTYDYLSGTGFYSQAIELASLGKNSDWSVGWDERWKKARKIKSNEYLRSMRFNFFSAMDALSIEKINVNLIKSSMNSFYEDLDKLDKKIGNDKETLHFLKAYHNQIAELCSALKMKDALQLLILYDSDHKDVYALYLNK